MAIYEYRCTEHGDFEVMSGMGHDYAPCPACSTNSKRIMSLPARCHVKFPERLRYGSGAKGRMLTHAETGGLDIFIPSGGAMEQAEIDDVACAAIEKEKSRVKTLKGQPRSANQAAITGLTQLAHRTKPGKRIEVLREAIKETGLSPNKLVRS